jgi:protein-S-isoprenylcysteine O-methyltransferase Ste14
MYVSILAALLGQVFIYGSPVVLLYAFCWWLGFYLFVRLYEEQALCKLFGEEYLRYLQTVNRWFPNIQSKSQN